MLRRVSVALAITSAALGAFCWWGLFTTAGQRRFDEMDGMYPFFAGVAAAIMAVSAAALFLMLRWRHRQIR